jgi:hypothetical protein
MLSREVLRSPAVVRQFRNTVNVLIDRAYGPEYVRYMATRYGVTSVPASVIVAPDGQYEARTGFIPKDRFLEFVAQARTLTGNRASPGAAPGERP